VTEPSMGVVADDLTGAMDTAGAFASQGLRVRVLRRASTREGLLSGVDVACINTQTRNVDSALALVPVRMAARDLIEAGFDRLYKKIDSTGRGNLAAECAAMLETTEAPAIIVCPAFPKLGRTVVEGRLLVHGQTVSTIPEGQDALAPVASTSLTEMLTLEGELSATSIGLSTVEVSSGQLTAAIRVAIDDGHNVVAVDAATDEHLNVLADASNALPGCVVAGSAGLAHAIAGRMQSDASAPIQASAAEGPALIIVGSRHEVNRAQLSALTGQGRATLVALEPSEALSDPPERRAHMARLRETVCEKLGAGRNVALAWSEPDSPAAPSLDPAADAADLGKFVGTLAYGVLRTVDVSGLVIAGGDTAFAVLGALGATSVDIMNEVEPGVPCGVISDGSAAGRTLVTKAGGFGDELTLTRALEIASGRIES